jgi:hypothetical protein
MSEEKWQSILHDPYRTLSPSQETELANYIDTLESALTEEHRITAQERDYWKKMAQDPYSLEAKERDWWKHLCQKTESLDALRAAMMEDMLRDAVHLLEQANNQLEASWGDIEKAIEDFVETYKQTSWGKERDKSSCNQ